MKNLDKKSLVNVSLNKVWNKNYAGWEYWNFEFKDNKKSGWATGQVTVLEPHSID